MANPHFEILQAVKAALEGPPVIGLGPVVVRELPYVLASADEMPLCVVCPPDGRGERVLRNLFRGPGGGITVWGYPVLVLLLSVSNRSLAAGLEARLQLRYDVSTRLFATDLSESSQVFDCDPDPAPVAPLQAALGANYVVSGFTFTYSFPRNRG